MMVSLTHNGSVVSFDVNRAIDISQPVRDGGTPSAFHLPKAHFVPFRVGDFVGSIEQGGPVRCEVITFAPHGNGTHTECVGHISGKNYLITDCMQDVLCVAELVTVHAELVGTDNVITLSALLLAWPACTSNTLVLRTVASNPGYSSGEWSGTNPPYIAPDAMALIVERGIEHLLIDTPSVDREEDGGALEAHHIFWQWPKNGRKHCTITELIAVPPAVTDGIYAIMFNVGSVAADAAPSRPLLFPLS